MTDRPAARRGSGALATSSISPECRFGLLPASVVALVGLGVLALSVPSGFAQQKIEGMVVALKITQCGMKPGSCKGLVEIGEPGKAHALQVEPATTTIKRAGKVVVAGST